jgi:hypothetical protein
MGLGPDSNPVYLRKYIFLSDSGKIEKRLPRPTT